jgi:hypothetical protein
MAKPPAKANGWNPNNNPTATHQNGPVLTPQQKAALTQPPVPSEDDTKGETVVNTDALDTFAANVTTLVPAVKTALTTLAGLPKVASGGFPEAYTISNQVTGGSGSGSGGSNGGGSGSDLADSFKMVLNYLSDGLTDIAGAASSMSKTYSTADELNNATVADVTKALAAATSDLGSLLTSDGGTVATPITPPTGS